jgi:hypothetical protein
MVRQIQTEADQSYEESRAEQSRRASRAKKSQTETAQNRQE